MKLRLTKTNKIVFAVSIVFLSATLGFLVWRVSDVEQQIVHVDTEAASGFCSDVDSNLKFPFESTKVCGDGCYTKTDECPTQRTLTINVPVEGKYSLTGVVARGHQINADECQCQPKEEFYLEINGKKSITAEDDYKTGPGKASCSVCPVTVIAQELGTFDLKAGINTIKMVSAAPKCPAGTPQYPNSVQLVQICLSALQQCGDGNLDSGEECEQGDPSGVKCSWPSCNQETCICPPAGLNITKSVVESCKDENTQNPVSELTYTIKVDNTGEGVGKILKLEDELDSKISQFSIVPSGISSPGQYSEGKILWDYTSSPLEILPQSSQTYVYKVEVGKDNFGLYENTVKLTPEQGDTLQASASISADCEISKPPPTIPETGIFDSTLGRVIVGITLLVVGAFVYTLPNKVFFFKGKPISYKYRDRFEKKF